VKVLHVIQRYPPAVGGSENWCRDLSQYLSAVGDDVRVATLDVLEEEEFWRDPPRARCTVRLGRIDRDGRVVVRRYRRSLPVYSLYHIVFRRLLDRMLGVYFYGPHSVEMYGRLLSEARAADVVHLHTVPYPHNFAGYAAGRLAGRRVVITPYFHPGHPHYERASHYWLLRRCDAVFVLSEYERDHLVRHGVAAAKIVVTGCGLPEGSYAPDGLPEFRRQLLQRYGLAETTALVLYVGRKVEYKGIAVLIDAVRALSSRHDVALLLAGPSLDWFEELYRALPAADKRRIIDLGVLSHQDKVNLLHLGHVLALPSQYESFGIVFLEAWTCGIPVIGAATGPMPGIIGEAGLTFQAGDAEDLSAKIAMILTDRPSARAMVERGRATMLTRYTWSTIGAAVRRAYRSRPAERLRILVCSNLFPPSVIGGAELVAYEQACRLRDAGHEVAVFCGGLGRDKVYWRWLAGGREEFPTTRVTMAETDLGGESWDFDGDPVRRRFARVVEQFRPDIVHFHNLAGLSITVVDECRRRRIPTVMTLHDYWGICFKNTMLKNDGSLCVRGGFDCLGCKETLLGERAIPSPVRSARVLLTLRGVDRLIAPSAFLAERYAGNGIPRESLSIVRYGIDTERFAPTTPRPRTFTLGFVGYLGAHKGLRYLLGALASLVPAHPVRLLAVGDGEDRERLVALTKELGLEPYVTFRGRVPHADIAALYHELDVLVVPSVWPENSPVTIMEAMASGIPVIASDIGGGGELVEDGITGFLVPPRDTRALAESIRHLLAHPDIREEMGRQAVVRIGRYGMPQQIERLVGLYHEILDAPRARPEIDDVVLLYDAPGWDRNLAEVFRQLWEVEGRVKRRLLMVDMASWDEDVTPAPTLALILSTGRAAGASALRALRAAVPLLVPESSPSLRHLCVRSNSGLFYADPEELGACVEFLLTHQPIRQAMALRGLRFATQGVAPDDPAAV
jgi:glycosyltransferase involved in cell wall biosynthesis